jgi:hypothetical protein
MNPSHLRQDRQSASGARLICGLLLLVLAGGCSGCSCTPNSPLVGQWRGDETPGTLVVYADRAVSLFGIRCRWIAAGTRAIRIESCLPDGASWIPWLPVQLAFDLRLTEDRDHALLSAGPFEAALERVP